jgi:hypothetical protein
MSNELLGLDVEASRVLAERLGGWSTRGEEIRLVLIEAELLSDIPTGVVGLVDEIGGDGAAMAAAIRVAADALALFTIELESPRLIAGAVASIHAFSGRANGPELDRRLRVLRGLVRSQTVTDKQAAHVMSVLLAVDRPLHVSGRNLQDVAAAMIAVARLNQAQVSGAITINDARIDAATGDLRAALAAHAASEAQLDTLLATFLSDRNHTSASTLLASVVSGAPRVVVEFAHEHGLDYDVAAGVLDMRKIDRLTGAIGTAPFPEVEELRRQRSELFAALVGADHSPLLERLARKVDQGVPAIRAFPVVFEEQVRAEQIDLVVQQFGLDRAAAAVQLDELAESAKGLISNGWQVEDAVVAANMAAKGGLELAEIEEFAADEDVSLIDGAMRAAEAQAFAMTIDEYNTFTGLVEYFPVLDTAAGTAADNLVSLADLRFVVNNSVIFSNEVAAAASALLRAPELLNRLDSAAATGGVVGHESFGRDRAADNKVSLTDVNLFVAKQQANLALRNVVDQIDVASQGGGLGWADGRLSEADFNLVLANYEDYGLTAAEVSAIEQVLEADWYDQTWMQEHGDTVILATAVVAGAALFAGTGGLGGGLSAALISSAAAAAGGATVGAGLTVSENLLTGDPLAQDLTENTVLGATGGLAGAGIVGSVAGVLVSQSLAVRVITTVGFEADVLGLAASGLLDPVLAPVVDEINLAEMRSDFQVTGYALGAASVMGGVGVGTAQRLTGGTLDRLSTAPHGDDDE